MRALLRHRFDTALPYVPLVGHIVPTLVAGFCFVIPGSPIDGINVYTLGFLAAVLGFIPVYFAGQMTAKRSHRQT